MQIFDIFNQYKMFVSDFFSNQVKNTR